MNPFSSKFSVYLLQNTFRIFVHHQAENEAGSFLFVMRPSPDLDLIPYRQLSELWHLGGIIDHRGLILRGEGYSCWIFQKWSCKSNNLKLHKKYSCNVIYKILILSDTTKKLIDHLNGTMSEFTNLNLLFTSEGNPVLNHGLHCSVQRGHDDFLRTMHCIPSRADISSSGFCCVKRCGFDHVLL